MKPLIRIVDSQFSHTPMGSFGAGDLNIPPTFFNWYRGDKISELVVITENSLHLLDRQQEKNKVALIIEPYSINPGVYDAMRNGMYKHFHTVLSHNAELVMELPNGRLYDFGGCWIKPEDRAIHEKTKGVSIIASDKKITFGHKLRHEVINTFGKRFDGIYGRGYKFVENKIEGLKDFHYHVVIENERTPVWITEKVIDCFVTGTIPIYYGTDAIKSIFNPDGILFFENNMQLAECLATATPEYYQSKLSPIQENFELAKGYVIPEDRLWTDFFEPTFFSE